MKLGELKELIAEVEESEHITDDSEVYVTCYLTICIGNAEINVEEGEVTPPPVMYHRE